MLKSVEENGINFIILHIDMFFQELKHGTGRLP
jgi:hypothetical protein